MARLVAGPLVLILKLDQKIVTGRLGLRNDDAHGDYDHYTAEQVRVMRAGVTDFIARHSA